MSKTVIIMRHAKTESYSDGGDRQRNLTSRGRFDAENKCTIWNEKGYPVPDLILYSPANRTVQTMNIIRNSLHISDERCIAVDKIYFANPHEIDEIIQSVSDNTLSCIAVIGHNNTLTDYLNHKINGFCIDNLPTSGFVGFELNINSWKDNSQSLKAQHLFHETNR